MSLHQRRTHPSPVDGCFACKVSTLMLAPSVAATTEWGAAALREKNMEKRWAADMPAYRRLREQGYQPPSIDGSAALESQASSRFEIESGRAFPGREKQVSEAVSFVQESIGRSVFEPAKAAQ